MVFSNIGQIFKEYCVIIKVQQIFEFVEIL